MYIDGDNVLSCCVIDDTKLLIPLEESLLLSNNWTVVKEIRLANLCLGSQTLLPGFHVGLNLYGSRRVGHTSWGKIREAAM